MARIIDNRTQADQTIRLFDSFYSTELVVGAPQFDIVFGYFSDVCANDNIAANFTTLLFRIAQEAGLDVLDLLEVIKGTPNKLQMNKIVAYYLNSFRSKTSLYGVGIVPKPNQLVARNIVQ